MVGFISSYSVLWLIGFGSILLIVGLFHRRSLLAKWDTGTFQILHNRLQPSAHFFRFVWPLGTTPVAVLLILILYIPGWKIGTIITLAYGVAALIERGLKLKMKRERPFQGLPDVRMQQPTQPRDPSHPSGDALRVWFLALVFPAAFGLLFPAYIFSLTVAFTLSLGRIALGVHFPLDIIGGAGLGILAAGISILVFQLSSILEHSALILFHSVIH